MKSCIEKSLLGGVSEISKSHYLFICKFIFLLRFANSLGYYGLSLSTGKMSGNPYVLLFIMALVEIPSYAVVISLLDITGRRFILSSFMIMGGMSLLLSAFIPAGMSTLCLFLSTPPT